MLTKILIFIKVLLLVSSISSCSPYCSSDSISSGVVSDLDSHSHSAIKLIDKASEAPDEHRHSSEPCFDNCQFYTIQKMKKTIRFKIVRSRIFQENMYYQSKVSFGFYRPPIS